jgi:hypothetical protein
VLIEKIHKTHPIVLVNRSMARVGSEKEPRVALVCEHLIDSGGFPANMQDTRIQLKITGNPRGLDAKQ